MTNPKSLEVLRELTFNEINNKFNIDRKLKDSDKSLRN